VKPKVGLPVFFRPAKSTIPSNAVKSHPAVITRVWDDDMVNLTVFFDGDKPSAIQRVPFSSENGDTWAYDE
jgi:hypothetical protein